MSLTNFTGDTSVISGLPDEPALTSAQLKAKFDEIGTSIKTFINGTHNPEIEQLVATEKSNIQGLITALGNQLREELLEDNKRRYHVGRIIFDTENVNPATYLGFGVWQLWGTGRVPVGVDVNDEDFDEPEKTGGEKAHTMTIEEMVEHTHGIRERVSGSLGTNSNSPHMVNGGTEVSWGADNTPILPRGGGQPFNIQQQYITCYMWKRVS